MAESYSRRWPPGKFIAGTPRADRIRHRQRHPVLPCRITIEAMSDSSPLFVASDVHGHYDALVEALRERGLVGEEAEWTGGDARLWILGDLFDRGQEGVKVVRLLRRLAEGAADEG
ncbi:metallophosphoesterase, partial [Glycomyces tenuis]|uniref:metallophosphoesterase n=1 Tax=Glycomyces tenuis TaxID=58116 RepID=UPI001B808FDA